MNQFEEEGRSCTQNELSKLRASSAYIIFKKNLRQILKDCGVKENYDENEGTVTPSTLPGSGVKQVW